MRSANCLAESTPSGSTTALLAWTHFGSIGLSQGLCVGSKNGRIRTPLPSPLDLLIVLANPLPHHLAHMPGRIVPDQQPLPFSLGCQALTTRLQKLYRDRAHRSSGDKAQPDLRTVRVIWRPFLPQGPRSRPGLWDRGRPFARIALPGARGAVCFARPAHEAEQNGSTTLRRESR